MVSSCSPAMSSGVHTGPPMSGSGEARGARPGWGSWQEAHDRACQRRLPCEGAVGTETLPAAERGAGRCARQAFLSRESPTVVPAEAVGAQGGSRRLCRGASGQRECGRGRRWRQACVQHSCTHPSWVSRFLLLNRSSPLPLQPLRTPAHPVEPYSRNSMQPTDPWSKGHLLGGKMTELIFK